MAGNTTNEGQRATAGAAMARRAPPRKTGFVGRERELSALTQRLETAARGEGGVVLLSGEPGIGKSRLLLELQARAQAAGWLVLSGRAYDTEGMPPYLAFAEAIAQYLRTMPDDEAGPRLAEAAREVALLVPELRERLPDAGDGPPLGPEATRYRLFEAVSDFFVRISTTSEAAGLLLCVDDLHWADRSTLLLFQHLTRKLRDARLLVVGTFRTEEVDRSRPLFDVLAELARGQQEQRLPLARLSPGETSSLIASLAGVTPPAALIWAIHQQTEGNPFFVQEVVRHLESQEHGLAGAGARPEDWGLSEGVREVIGRRLSRLGVETQRLIESAAVLGDGFDVALLRTVDGSEAATVARALEDATGAAMLREEAGCYVFGHPMIRQVIYDGLSLPRRQELHLRAAEAIETIHAGRLGPHLSALAAHYRLAGTTDPGARKAVLYSKLAAEQAEAASSWDEAAQHYETCLTLIAGSELTPDVDEASLLLRHGSAARYAGNVRAGWRSLMRSLDLFRARKDANGAGRAALVAMSVQAPVARRIGVLDLALGTEGERDPAIEAALWAYRAASLGFPAGDADADRAEAICRRTAAPEASGLVKDYRGRAAWRTSRPEESLRLHKASVDELLEHGLQASACECFWFYLMALLLTGRLDDTRAAALRYEKLAQELGDAVHLDTARFGIACNAFLGAEFDTAAEVLGHVPDAFAMRPLLAVNLAEARGELAAIEKLVLPIETLGGVEGLVADASAARAEAFFLAGEHEEAQVELARLQELVPRSTTDTWGELIATGALIALGSEAAVRATYERYSGRSWMRAILTGSADRIRGQLALRLGLVDEAAEWFRAGLEWCERERCPVEAGLCLHGLAEVAACRGQRDEALRLLSKASVLFEAHGAKLYLDRANAARDALFASARSLKRLLPAAYPGGLTAREVEVLGLITRGKSNREIGAELVLSLRTVERHIVNIYSKLDIHSRAQATAYAFTHELAPPPG